MPVDFFEDAAPTQAYLKAGLIGGAGDGKTYTAALMAIGLHDLCADRGLPVGSNPVALLESSEFGVDWIMPMFTARNIQLKHRKSKSFADFSTGMRRAAEAGMICIVDSVTGYWVELVEAHRMALGRIDLMMEDWAALKQLWAQTMEDFKNLPGHIILCGRAGFEYARFENEATGRMELERTGVRMKAEGDTGYEPSLLVYLKKQFDMSDPARPRMYHTATILKDRSQAIHGMTFDNPTFQTFLPHIERINLGGRHISVGAENSQHLVVDRRSGRAWFEEKTCILDEIDTLLANSIPGMSADEKKRRGDLLKTHFSTLSRERLKTLPIETLKRGYNSLHIELVGIPPTVPGEIPAAGQVNQAGGESPNPMAELAAAFDNPTACSPVIPAAPAPNAQTSQEPGTTPTAKPETDQDITKRIIAAADTAPVPPVRRRGRPRKEEIRAHAEAVIGDAPQPMPENGQPDKVAQSEEDHKAETAERARRTLAGVTEPVDTNPAVPARRGRGRPPGVKNKPVADAADTPGVEVKPENGQTIDATDSQAAPPPARKRGRPPGAKNKKTAEVEALSASLAARQPETPTAGPDVGSWSIFLPEATKAAAAQGISGGRFNEGINKTLINARLMAISQDRIPREFLLDFYDAIVEGRWNVESGSFTSAKPQLAMAEG